MPLTREEEGIGVCTGAFMAGRRAALMMQNAGLLNACNSLTTTALQFEVPMLLLARARRYPPDFAAAGAPRRDPHSSGVPPGLLTVCHVFALGDHTATIESSPPTPRCGTASKS